MKKLLLTFTTLTFLAVSPASADADCTDTINVKVNGLVCDFCARALEKVFGKRENVKDIKVDLDNGNVIITMKPDQTINDETLTELIGDSGYNVSEIKRGCDE